MDKIFADNSQNHEISEIFLLKIFRLYGMLTVTS